MKTILLVFTMLLAVSNKNYKTVLKAKALNYLEITFTQEAKLKAYHNYKYNEVLDLIKLHEGFRSNPYDDGGYPCIGYGQRLKFFPNFKIKHSITRLEADSILKISFENHLKLVDYYFPGLNTLQRYAVAHMSYGIGIGNVIKAQYIYKDNGKWKINKYRLYNYRKVDRTKKNYRDNRVFEYELFNS